MGVSGSRLRRASLSGRVRQTTGAVGDAFRAEERVPRPAAENPGQKWRAGDVETLWESPMVGATGTTVGSALVAMLAPGEQFIRQVEALGQGLAGGGHGVFAEPLLGSGSARSAARRTTGASWNPCPTTRSGRFSPSSRDRRHHPSRRRRRPAAALVGERCFAIPPAWPPDGRTIGDGSRPAYRSPTMAVPRHHGVMSVSEMLGLSGAASPATPTCRKSCTSSGSGARPA